MIIFFAGTFVGWLMTFIALTIAHVHIVEEHKIKNEELILENENSKKIIEYCIKNQK